MAVFLGVDFGLKRVGLALSDYQETFAVPLTIHQYRSKEYLIDYLHNLIDSRNIKKLIFGLPLNSDGTEGKKAKETIRYVDDLSHYISEPIVLWDERYSTQEAETRLSQIVQTKKKMKKHLDSIAAQIILQSYLDHHSNGFN
ncbi:MAG: Holliday junction resolvase RuvX [Nitrospinae bacterium]|nr:Holliday junction resolvase RuvX [Nitrospinota bacterium]